MAIKRPYPSFLIFRDKEGNWRWNFAGPGGRILATSSHAYPRGRGCVRAVQLLRGANDYPVVGSPEDMKLIRERTAALKAAAAAKGASAAAGEGPDAAAAKPAGKKAATSAKPAETAKPPKTK